jgi:hypothetical protein
MFTHELRLIHSRTPSIVSMEEYRVDSAIDISTSSVDLTEAFRELLSRLPNDVYAALKDAMSATIVQKSLP